MQNLPARDFPLHQKDSASLPGGYPTDETSLLRFADHCAATTLRRPLAIKQTEIFGHQQHGLFSEGAIQSDEYLGVYKGKYVLWPHALNAPEVNEVTSPQGDREVYAADRVITMAPWAENRAVVYIFGSRACPFTYINAPYEGYEENCEFVQGTDLHAIFVRTLRPIAAGEQLIARYGDCYPVNEGGDWPDISEAPTTGKRRHTQSSNSTGPHTLGNLKRSKPNRDRPVPRKRQSNPVDDPMDDPARPYKKKLKRTLPKRKNAPTAPPDDLEDTHTNHDAKRARGPSAPDGIG